MAKASVAESRRLLQDYCFGDLHSSTLVDGGVDNTNQAAYGRIQDSLLVKELTHLFYC